MIHKQYNEIMANSKKKGKDNLYSALTDKEIAERLPIHISSVKRILKGKGLIRYKDKFHE